MHDRLGEALWSKQIEIMRSVADNRRTAVQSCHGVGKSFSAARLITWWIDTHPPGEAFVVSTAPTNPQVEAVLWREINKAFPKANPPLPGRVLIKEWKIGNELVGYGRKPADYDPAAFQGIHARFVLVVLDEACGIPEALWTAAGALVTNEGSRILAIGNPDDSTGHFAKICKGATGWNVLRIRAQESPNFTGEYVSREMSEGLVSQDYLDDLIADGCGPGTPIWSAKVEGEFPEDSEDSVVRPSAVAKCRLPDQVHDHLEPIELGVDVGAGGDFSVIMARFGPVARLVKRSKTPDTMALVDDVIAAIEELGATRVKVDKTGIGWGVTDRLVQMRAEGKHNAQIVGVMVGAASRRPDRYPKLRDQIWWEVGRLMSENNAWDLSALDDATIAQLTAPKHSPDASGRVKVERKDDTKKRLGRSPDDADALLLAFYNGGASSAKDWLESMAPPCSCGQPNTPDSMFCVKCGKQLKTDEPEPEEQSPDEPAKPFSPWHGPSELPPDAYTRSVQSVLATLPDNSRSGLPAWIGQQVPTRR